MAGITQEQVILHVMSRDDSGVQFRATYFGVFLFSKTLTKKDEVFSWS
jgi:hypothetical protein